MLVKLLDTDFSILQNALIEYIKGFKEVGMEPDREEALLKRLQEKFI